MATRGRSRSAITSRDVDLAWRFDVLDRRPLAPCAAHEQPRVGVQQVPRAAEEQQRAQSSEVAEERVQHRVLAVLADPALGELELTGLHEPGVVGLHGVDLRVLHPQVERGGDEAGEVRRPPPVLQEECRRERDVPPAESVAGQHERARRLLGDAGDVGDDGLRGAAVLDQRIDG